MVPPCQGDCLMLTAAAAAVSNLGCSGTSQRKPHPVALLHIALWINRPVACNGCSGASTAAATAVPAPNSYLHPPNALAHAGANLTATITPGGQTTCIKLLSPQLNKNGTTLTAPGEGLCNTNGTMPPGTYNLDQRPPQGTEFDRWDCYDVSGTTPGQPDVDVDSVTLQEGDVITCVAVFTMRPKLALISEFPAGYSGPSEFAVPDVLPAAVAHNA